MKRPDDNGAADEEGGKNIRAKKRFGQNFLRDKNLLARIVRTAGVKSGERVIEVGPGAGALTEALLGAGALVTAIEADRDLYALIEDRFGATPGFELIRADVLKVSFDGMSRAYGQRLKVVSNIPYNITGPLIIKFLDERSSFTTLVLMLQKEVAQRLAAVPSTKEYGALTVIVRAYFDVKIEFHVSKNLFFPRPKVDSSVVSFAVLDEPRVTLDEEKAFRRVVKGAFGHRRKTLLNSVATSLGIGKETAAGALCAAAIDPVRRAETLGIDDFLRLTRALAPFLTVEAAHSDDGG